MKILYILPFVPWVGRVRSYHLIPRLGRKHEIYLLCRSSSDEEESRAQEMQPYCRSIRCVRHSATSTRGIFKCALALPTPIPLRMAYFASRTMRNAVREATAKFSPDLIYVERWRALQWVPRDVGIPIISDPTDSMTLYNWRLIGAGTYWEKVIGLEEALKFRWYEPRLSRRSQLTIFCSDVDLECVQKRSPKSRFANVCNGVDTRKFFFKPPTEEEDNRVVFTGSFTYGPNRHAVNFFVKKILPIVRQRVPSVKFAVVGNQAARHFGHLNGCDGVEVLDFVPLLRPYIARATVAIAPMTVAVGILTKLLEAFAVGTAVVATSRACTGLPVQNGEHLLMADTASAFAEGVIRLLHDGELRRLLALNARRFVERTCDWDTNAARMEGLMQQVTQSWIPAADSQMVSLAERIPNSRRSSSSQSS